MRDWFLNLSLRNKLVLTILVCLVLPSFVSVSMSNLFTRDVVRSQVTEYSQESMRVANQFVADQLKNVLHVMNFVQFDEELQFSIRELGRMNGLEAQNEALNYKQTISKRLETVINSLGHLQVTVLLPNKQYVASYSTFGFDPADFFNKSWFRDMSQVSGYNAKWIGAEPNYTRQYPSQPYVLTAAKPLRTNSVTYAYVIVNLEMGPIQELFDQTKANETMLIIDREGRILVDKDFSSIGTFFPHYDQLPTDNRVSFLNVAGEQYIMLSNQITPEWRLISMSPYRQAAQKIEWIRRMDFMIQLLLLILFAVILLYMVGTLTQPIMKLARTVVRIESGQLSERSNIRGRDEVGQLGYVFDRMLDRIEQILEENRHEQELKRKAELEMLQAQINPHFLFNVLNSIRLKIMMKGDEENAELISSLSSLLRMTINRNNEFITLYEEIEINKHYIRILNSRHGEQIELTIQAASDTLMCEIPRFLLQPLIENAFIHGLKSKSGEIIIASKVCEDDRLQVEVQDSGVGMSDNVLNQLRFHLGEIFHNDEGIEGSPSLSGIGLHNVFERLRLIYGQSFELTIDSKPGRGAHFIMRFPKRARRDGV